MIGEQRELDIELLTGEYKLVCIIRKLQLHNTEDHNIVLSIGLTPLLSALRYGIVPGFGGKGVT